ncbi:unnamed protein product [Moneuplotes crassus]|uniref:Uncharacterized protein n=1 Tax=Euplotes crassus TaxID=5936 RepID=A0AAD1XBG9_EUPCR|nr:unnamed protein product [Moneuplotes crassus]
MFSYYFNDGSRSLTALLSEPGDFLLSSRDSSNASLKIFLLEFSLFLISAAIFKRSLISCFKELAFSHLSETLNNPRGLQISLFLISSCFESLFGFSPCNPQSNILFSFK